MTAPSVGADQFDDEFLDSLRLVGDPPADDAAGAYIDSELEAHAKGLMAALLARNVGHAESNEASAALHAFAVERPPLPPWTDLQMVVRGQDLFAEFVPQLGLGLWMASIPAGYAGAHGAQVLTHTARLVSDPKRRFLETGQFIVDVMTVGGLEPGAAGSRDLRHIRLLHAAARHLLLDTDDRTPTPFDTEKYGHPINQEDMLGTLFTFSLVGLHVLERAGVRLSDDDAEAYVHTWNVIGHLMGIRADLLPLSRADSEIVFERIRTRNYSESPAGRELTAAAIEVMQELLGLRALRGVPAAGIREYLGPDVANLLGVPNVRMSRLLFLPPRVLNRWSYRVDNGSRVARGLTRWAGRRMFQGFLAYERDGAARPSFDLSDALREQLRLK